MNKENEINSVETLMVEEPWAEHSFYTRFDWRQEVATSCTQLGYWDWVEHKIEAEDTVG
jgi:hypothetical protein